MAEQQGHDEDQSQPEESVGATTLAGPGVPPWPSAKAATSGDAATSGEAATADDDLPPAEASTDARTLGMSQVVPLATQTALMPTLAVEQPDRYLRTNLLGQGGIGAVHSAIDRALGREIAIKSLRRDRQTDGAEVRFVEEARVTGQLEHPGIVPVYDIGRDARGGAYYTMPRIRGQTLADAMQGADLEHRLRLLPRLVDVCQAVAYAHARGVIHRDLKPANVMLGAYGETLVLDWGLAKTVVRRQASEDADEGQISTVRDDRPVSSALRSGGAFETQEGSVVGTPAYMAPEQARGAVASVDARSDVWSLGVILYELLTGAPPFTGRTAWEVLQRVLEQPPRDPATIERRAPPELAAIAMRCLDRDQDRRYQDAGTLALDLVAFTEGRLVRAHTYRLRDRVRRWARRNAVRIVAVASLLAVGASAWWARDHQARTEALERRRAADSAALAEAERIFDEARVPRDATWVDAAVARLIARRREAMRSRLTTALVDPSPAVRRIAARALGAMAISWSVPALLARLAPDAEQDPDVVVDIIRALGAIGDPSANAAVDAARRRFGQWSPVWTSTISAFQMIPPDTIAADKLQSADAWVDRGNQWMSKRRIEDALAHYTKAIELDPRSARAWTNRGMALRHQGLLHEALRSHSRALEIQPLLPAALNNRALIRRLRHEAAAATADFDVLLDKTDALRSIGRRGRVWTRWRSGDVDGALADLDRLIRDEPRSARNHLLVATVAAWRDDLDLARASLDRALQLDPKDALVLRWRAEVQWRRGELPAARADFNAAIAADATVERGLAMRAAFLGAIGEPGMAAVDLDRQLSEQPEIAASWVDRAILQHAAAGQWALALADLDKAASLALPSERVDVGLLRAAVAARAGRQVALPEPNGEIPLHDALVAVARGELGSAEVAAQVDDANSRCLLGLSQRLAGKGAWDASALRASARSAAEAADPACTLLTLLGDADAGKAVPTPLPR